jgi:NADH-quinone oxidoreductase subunit F
VTGPASVIGAISAGQKAAVSIDKKLGGSGSLPQDIGFSFTKPDEEALLKSLTRPEEKSIPLKERKRGFAEVVLGLDQPLALAEAGRCLRCDLEK